MDHNTQVEAEVDRTHPNWRAMPVMRLRPWAKDPKAVAAWEEEARNIYPAGWFESGGPVITHRTSEWATRHVPGRAPGGGYEMGSQEPAEESGQLAMFS